jgi:hypothetical protein
MSAIHILTALISGNFIYKFQKVLTHKSEIIKECIVMKKKKVIVAYKDRTSQLNTIANWDSSIDLLENYKRAITAAIESLERGHIYDAEIFLKVGLLGGNVNDTDDMAEKIISWAFNNGNNHGM